MYLDINGWPIIYVVSANTRHHILIHWLKSCKPCYAWTIRIRRDITIFDEYARNRTSKDRQYNVHMQKDKRQWPIKHSLENWSRERGNKDKILTAANGTHIHTDIPLYYTDIPLYYTFLYSTVLHWYSTVLPATVYCEIVLQYMNNT